MSALLDLRRRLERLTADLDHAERQVADESARLREAEEEAAAALEAQEIVQRVAEGVQNKAHRSIASVVTRCLRAVYGKDAYEFKIRFSRKRGRTEAKLLFIRDGNELEDPCDESGAGQVVVAAFALRLVALVLSRPQRRRLLVLDEPLRQINGDVYRDRVRGMIESLAREFGIQFIIASNEDWMKIGKVVQL
jgi:hypothetical protein